MPAITLKENWLSRLTQPFRRVYHCTKGIAAVEFGLLIPILLVFWLGTNEFGQALMIDRRVTLTASTVADLIAQSEVLTEDQLDEILALSDSLMAPSMMSLYKQNKFRLHVLKVTKNTSGELEVEWSREKVGSDGQASTRFPLGTITASAISPSFDADVVLENSHQIIAIAEYDYMPTVGHFIGGTVTLSDTFFLSPRFGNVRVDP